MTSVRRFTYVAPDQTGRLATRTLYARDRADALRRLSEDGAAPLSLSDAEPATTLLGAQSISVDEASLVLRQLAVMIGAGVDLLEAIEAAATALDGRVISGQLRGVALALRRGDPFAAALATHAPSYPAYVLALLRAGEESGRLGQALDEAARQMKSEARLTRDIQNALVYPAFLVLSGALSVSFILYAVVPRFADMLGAARTDLDALSAFILALGMGFHQRAPLIVASVATFAVAVVAFARTADGKHILSRLALATPVLGPLLRARQHASWSRIMAILLAAGLDVLTATRTAADTLSDGPLKRGAVAAIAQLRAGRSVDQAFLSTNTLSPIEASVIAAGSRSGALPAMFEAIAQKSEEDTRDALKRFTAILEPLAVAIVAGFIGAIVVGLVSALAGIYETVG